MRKKLKIGLGLFVSVLLIMSLVGCSGDQVASTYQVDVGVVEGEGSVEVNPNKESYEEGEEVSIEAIADDNWVFVEWRGSISSENREETIVIDNDMTVGAVFEVDQDITGEGTADDPYMIYTAEGLRMMEEDYEAYYQLARDIDLADYGNWDPIGNFDDPPNTLFSGELDGDGFSIKNASIANDDPYGLTGLFLIILGSRIQNLNIVDADVQGVEDVGVLAGRSVFSEINDVSVKSSTISGDFNVGSLVGSLYADSVIENSSAEDVEIIGEDVLGGLAGLMGNEVLISQSYFNGTVEGNDKVGGLTGRILKPHDDEEEAPVIKNSFAVGAVSATGDVAGLVGENYGDVINSYAAVEVDAFGPEESSGGAIATNNGSVEGVYYDKEVSGMDDENKGEPKTTEEMMTKSTFSEWDFEEVWAIEDGYPFLQ